jgi:hypothetical protein
VRCLPGGNRARQWHNRFARGECWRLLERAEVGRLAVAVAGEPEIFPLNFVVYGHSLVFRTAQGTKLAAIIVSPRVAFEIDGYEPDLGQAWSVVAKGRAERLDHFRDIHAVEDLPLFPWHPGYKGSFVRIREPTLTGRSFTVVHRQRED